MTANATVAITHIECRYKLYYVITSIMSRPYGVSQLLYKAASQFMDRCSLPLERRKAQECSQYPFEDAR